MPKMKTKSGAKKRFKVTGTGKVKFKKAYMRHMQMNKPKSMKRKAKKKATMFSGDENLVLRNFLPYDRKNLRRRKDPAQAIAAQKAGKAKTTTAKKSKAKTKKAGE